MKKTYTETTPSGSRSKQFLLKTIGIINPERRQQEQLLTGLPRTPLVLCKQPCQMVKTLKIKMIHDHN